MIRKGISTFIATILLMILAVSAGVVIYAFTMGYLGGFDGMETLGAMSLDSVSVTEEVIIIWIRNIGRTTIVIEVAYIDGMLENIYPYPGDNLEDSYKIKEGKISSFIIIPSFTLKPNHQYDIKIIAEDNTQISFITRLKEVSK